MKKGSGKKSKGSAKGSSKSSKVEVQTGPGKKRTKDGYHAKKEYARTLLEGGKSRQDAIAKLVDKYGIDRRYAYSILPPVSEFPMKAREGQAKRTVFRDENGEIVRTTPLVGEGKEATPKVGAKKVKKTAVKGTVKAKAGKASTGKKATAKKVTGKKPTPAPPVKDKTKKPGAKKTAKVKKVEEADVEDGEVEGENEEEWDF